MQLRTDRGRYTTVVTVAGQGFHAGGGKPTRTARYTATNTMLRAGAVTLVELVQPKAGPLLLLADLGEGVLEVGLLLLRRRTGTVRFVRFLQHVQRQAQVAVERDRFADLPIDEDW